MQIIAIEISKLVQKHLENPMKFGEPFPECGKLLVGIIRACLALEIFQPKALLQWVQMRLKKLGRHYFERACACNEQYADRMFGAEYIAYVAKHGGLNEEELRVLKSKLDHGMTLDSYYDTFASTLEQDTYYSLSGSDCP